MALGQSHSHSLEVIATGNFGQLRPPWGVLYILPASPSVQPQDGPTGALEKSFASQLTTDLKCCHKAQVCEAPYLWTTGKCWVGSKGRGGRRKEGYARCMVQKDRFDGDEWYQEGCSCSR